MSTLRQLLESAVRQAFAAQGLDPAFGIVMTSQRPDLGQFQCTGALAAARSARRKPALIAADVSAMLSKNDIFSHVSVGGPGFINLTVSDRFLAAHVNSFIDDSRLGCPPVSRPLNTLIDFGGPNVAKAMHVGHLRSSIIGDCLQRLLRFVGHHVTSDIHLGDWGTQMGMLICEVKRLHPELPYFDPNYTGPYPTEPPVAITELGEIYPEAAARSKADPEAARAARQATAELQEGRPGYRALWQHFVTVSREALEQDFGVLGIRFDLWLGESSVQNRIRAMLERLKEQGSATMSEGMLVVDVQQESDKHEIPPLILVKSDGGVIYGTTDLATIEMRVQDLKADEILYVVDNRQSLHFDQVFRAAHLTGIAAGSNLEHIQFGTVNGPDGKPFKTRAGGVMRLQDLLAMATAEAQLRMTEAGLAGTLDETERQSIAARVGIAAVKFADLVHSRTSDYVFQLEKFTDFDGCTGPYLLYAAVRVKALLRKAEEAGLVPGPLLQPGDLERDLVLMLCGLPTAIDEAATTRMPHVLCDFSYHLAKCFSRFYHSCHVLSEPDKALQASWLSLIRLFLRELELLLSILGIDIPERM